MNDSEKSGRHDIKCSDCDYKYLVQARKFIKSRFREHVVHVEEMKIIIIIIIIR